MNILVTLLHKGQINIRFEVSSWIALEFSDISLAYRARTHQLSCVCLENTVAQGANSDGCVNHSSGASANTVNHCAFQVASCQVPTTLNTF